MKNGYWVIRTYESGAVGEKIKYFIPGERPSRSRRKINSEINRQEKNETQVIRSLARLLNANFKKGDILLTLDYSDEGLDVILDKALESKNIDIDETIYKAAEHEMKLCLRRVKRECDMLGIELKYAATTSDMDGETNECVRVHHHLVINREALSVFKEKWTLGEAHHEPLSGQKDYTAIAEYFIKQVRKIKDAKKYVSSRNLLRPQPKDRVAVNNSELRTPAKAVLLHRSEYRPDRPQYIRYLKCEEEGEEQIE